MLWGIEYPISADALHEVNREVKVNSCRAHERSSPQYPVFSAVHQREIETQRPRDRRDGDKIRESLSEPCVVLWVRKDLDALVWLLAVEWAFLTLGKSAPLTDDGRQTIRRGHGNGSSGEVPGTAPQQGVLLRGRLST